MDALAPTAAPRLSLRAWPALCELCRRWSNARLCADCVARWAAPRPRCARCGLGTGVALAACGDCLRDPPPFEHTIVVADYVHPWDRLLTDLKFHAQVPLAAALAPLMAHACGAAVAPRPHVLVPVPMSSHGLRSRGFNQAWELARRVARQLELPAQAGWLERVADTAHQIELNRAQRLANLRAAFQVPRDVAPKLAGARVLLVDDVMTTGATAREASAALLRAGAQAVDLLVFARTPTS